MNIKLPNITYTFAIAGGLLACTPAISYAQNKKQAQTETAIKKDTFVKLNIPQEGTSDPKILAYAPSPKVKIEGNMQKATIVVDLSRNALFHYDEKGKPMCAYLIAKGKPSTPTHKGIRIVSHIEKYPYRGAYKGSQRRRTPGAFGPNIIILEKLDVKTGERTPTGEFIHGTNVPSSIGKNVSHGCMRMNNEVIKKLAKIIKPDDIVIIK